MTTQREALNEAAAKVGAASAVLARYQSLLSTAASLKAPAVAHALQDLRRTAAQIEVVAITLSQAGAA